MHVRVHACMDAFIQVYEFMFHYKYAICHDVWVYSLSWCISFHLSCLDMHMLLVTLCFLVIDAIKNILNLNLNLTPSKLSTRATYIFTYDGQFIRGGGSDGRARRIALEKILFVKLLFNHVGAKADYSTLWQRRHHMEAFPDRCIPLTKTVMVSFIFFLMFSWTICWTNNCFAGDSRSNDPHVTVM